MAERRSTHHCPLLRSLLFLSLASPLLTAGMAHAQHTEETARQVLRLKAYGMYSFVDPDFDLSKRNNGVTIGGDIDGFRLLPHTELGMDLRYTYTRGIDVNQTYFGGGPRLSANLGPFKPYVDFLFGHGRGDFNHSTDPNYTHDTTGAMGYGGGLEYQVTRSWALRGDVLRQNWRFSIHQEPFYPVAASLGVSYTFHFHSRTGPNL